MAVYAYERCSLQTCWRRRKGRKEEERMERRQNKKRVERREGDVFF
jgi:hypothetical protein